MAQIIIIKLVLKPFLGLRGKNQHTVKLPSNSSTGCSWTRRVCCCPSIISDTHHYVQFPGPLGTGGEEIWTFAAIAKGAEIVRLAYAPDYSPEDIQDEIEIHFSVR